MASDLFHRVVLEELASSDGARLRCFTAKTICLTALWTAFSLAFGLAWHITSSVLRLGFAAPFYLVVFTIVKFSAMTVLLLLWKLSVVRIDHLRDRVASHDANVRLIWRDVTREYKDVAAAIDEMWRKTGFSNAWALMSVSDLVEMGGILGTTKHYTEDAWSYLSYFWVLSMSVALAIVVYCFTSINDKSVSAQHSTRSVLHIGRQHLGKVPPRHVMDHLCFLHCVEGLPCGVEIFGAG
eukprot:CAMPEP_0198530326 /NCGR_PEP_ID=MMETSP1462-20131121/26286_1 /TAXON_ID=1333877 /ORGANISM="Brandtodinium nutriculum, Strain RCC3387" /LENGTH=238 /DNA_ID=CAMNT_0044260199 /DNA_START=260 /DNA_END=973 /DNA_ORIENTATION=+